jgi:hypothetical protein
MKKSNGIEITLLAILGFILMFGASFLLEQENQQKERLRRLRAKLGAGFEEDQQSLGTDFHFIQTDLQKALNKLKMQM